MNCQPTENLLLAERDGVLTSEQRAALASHLEQCPSCRQFRAVLEETANTFKHDATTVAVPDIDEEWNLVRAKLSADRGETARAKKRPLAPVIWFGAPLAAAAAVVFAFLTTANDKPDTSPQTAQANYVEAGDSNASTMVYVDKESGWLVVWAS